jgi:predicted aconitase with swiveling domain
MSWQSEVLFEGEAHGDVLRFDAPISFWGGVNPVTSEVTLAGHPQRGQKIAGKMLVIPQLIGSSSSSAVILELFYTRMAPRALILGGRDAILPVGVIVARQMDWPTIPVVVLPEPPFQTDDVISIARDGHIEKA